MKCNRTLQISVVQVHFRNSPETAMKSILPSAKTFARHPLVLACSIALAAASGNAHADQAADMQAKLDALTALRMR